MKEQRKTHREAIAGMTQSLSELSTHPKEVEHLGSPEHQEYEECWRSFHRRYHHAVIQYLLKKAHWGQRKINDVTFAHFFTSSENCSVPFADNSILI